MLESEEREDQDTLLSDRLDDILVVNESVNAIKAAMLIWRKSE